MRKLIVFNNVTLDGYFTGENGDLSWAHSSDDAEFNAFIEENAGSGGHLLFGRITYEMMAGYWPTPQAKSTAPAVAEGMNKSSKVVFSRTLHSVSWNNTKLVKNDIISVVRKMKEEPGEGMVLMGSGSIISQLAAHNLIDEYQLVVHPLVLGKGRTMFDGITQKLNLKLTKTRSFTSGKLYSVYGLSEPRTSESGCSAY